MGYWLTKAILTPLLRMFLRPKVKGVEHLPTAGGAIMAANHTTFIDNFMIPLIMSRRVVFLAKSDYFTGRGVKGRLQRAFFSGVGMIPIDRSGGEASEGALRTGLRVLDEGGVMGLFPEGTRSPDGRLYRGRTGVARMALEAGVPVIPVGLVGMFALQPAGRLLPKFGKVEVRIGKPLDFSRYAGMENDRFVLRSITDEIMYELMVLSGQEYVDTYATKAKAEIELAR
ncbi:MAG: 1-acyl-sn-glycerol-3-phosphate acyltransferase, partial [Frankiales bacterium]|nr:1-acyl-sn-glycerol-3-phosphate acyltransferase [Frankiales bacterium]